MADHESRTKRAPQESWADRHCNDNRSSPLEGERHILELISKGAPLAGILNRLCALVDVQVGDVVSLFLLPDGESNHLCSFTQSAIKLGLYVFSSTDILSRDETRLGTLVIYGCDPRWPTADEYRLIERAVCLAAIALECHGQEQDSERPSGHSRSGMDSELERPPFIN